MSNILAYTDHTGPTMLANLMSQPTPKVAGTDFFNTRARRDVQKSFRFRRERSWVDSACLKMEENVCLNLWVNLGRSPQRSQMVPKWHLDPPKYLKLRNATLTPPHNKVKSTCTINAAGANQSKRTLFSRCLNTALANTKIRLSQSMYATTNQANSLAFNAAN